MAMVYPKKLIPVIPVKENEIMEKSNLELKKIVDCVAFICLSCRHMALAPIYGLFEKESGMLVSVAKGHEKQFICGHCKEIEEEKIRLTEEDRKFAAEKEGEFLVMKTLDPIEFRMFIREIVIPELLRAINEGEFKIGCKVIE